MFLWEWGDLMYWLSEPFSETICTLKYASLDHYHFAAWCDALELLTLGLSIMVTIGYYVVEETKTVSYMVIFPWAY